MAVDTKVVIDDRASGHRRAVAGRRVPRRKSLHNLRRCPPAPVCPGSIYRIDPATFEYTDYTDALLGHPLDLAADASGNLYAIDSTTPRIVKYTAAGGTWSVWKTGLTSPQEIALSGDGHIYVRDGQSILKFDLAGNPATPWSPAVTDPSGLAADSSGCVYVCDAATHVVKRLSPDGTLEASWGAANSFGDFYATGLAVAPDASAIYGVEADTCSAFAIRNSFTYRGVFDNSEAAVNIAEINGQPPAQFGGFIGDDTLHAAVDYVCQDGLPMRFESDFTRTDDPETYRFITTWNLLADVYGTRSWTVTGVSSQDIGRIAYFPAGVSIRGLSAPVSGTIDYTLTINEAETEYELYAAGAGAFVPANTQDRAAFYAYQKSELVGNEYQTSYWLNGFAKSGGVTFKLEPPLALEDSELPRITLTLGKNDTPIVASDCILGKLEIVVPDQNGDPVPSAEVPFSEPAPQVILGDISLNDVEIDGEVATVHISGEVFDPIADNFPRRPISYGGADIEEVAVFVDGAECSLHIPVTPDPAYEQAHKSFWRQHPFRGTFDTTIEIVGKDVKVLVVSTAPNVANYSAMDVAWLYFTPSYQEGPYVLEDVENQEGSEPGTYHPFLHRISAKVGRPEDCRFLHRGVETEVEEDDGYYYPKGGSKEVIVYVMIDKNDENARPLKKRPTEKRLRPYRITYEVTDEGLIYKKSDRVWKTYQCYLDAADCLFQTKSLYWYSQRIGSYRGLSSIHATLAAAESSTKPYSSLGCHMCPEANCLLSDLSGLFTMPGLGTIDWWLGCIMRSQWKVPGLEFLQLCMELPGNGAWQRLAFMIEHWEHVKPACELFAIPPEVFFATIFAEHSDNKWNSDLGERWNAHYLDFPKCTGFGLANLPENAASDGTWLGYNLHSPAYMQNPGVPEAVRTAYAALAPNDREARITAFYNNRQLSIWVHAARMRAIADTLADTQVGLNPDRFNRRIGENYDWSTKYIDDNVSLLSLANFVMLATEQTGFARIPLSWEVADRGMIDIPFGDHMEESTTVRENIGYVNVWKVFGDSLFPGDWQAEGGRKYNDGYGFCVEDVYSYNVSYKDAVFIFEVFKTSSVYRGE